MSLSKPQRKLIRSLEHRKYRQETGLFIAEGKKVVDEFLFHGWKPYLIVATEQWAKEHSSAEKVVVTDLDTIRKITLLKSPPEVVGVFYQQEKKLNGLTNKLGIALDEVQDAGNVGTIMRLALWFGIDYVILGNGCADRFNPKVIQASMGAVASLACWSQPLQEFFSQHTSLSVYGTFLEGTPVYEVPLTSEGVILMGNEGKGIHPQLHAFVHQKIYIPPYPLNAKPIDSINVAMATAIICYEFRRKRH